ncbi:MAG: cation transporter [Oscillospiraceae bacterium]|nr:cation transporter [Oscillospiraceae bacterium]
MNQQQETTPASREKMIIRTSIIGIFANLFLAAFKAAVGLLSHSIAIVLDAVNNLSDALSSVITIVGTKLAGKRPDKKHPLGYGRIEYLSAMVVAAIVLYAGITAGVESVRKLFEPETPDYSIVTLIVVGAAVVVKLVLGRYVKSVGERVHSSALIASGSDASFDAVLSVATLACAILYLLVGVQLEAVVGVVISLVIIKAGVEMLAETLDDILGKRMEPEFLSEIRKTIHEDPDVQGVFDLILHSYGPDRIIGSVHVEVPDTMDAEDIDQMERRIADQVFLKHGVLLTGIGIYAYNTKNDAVKEMRTAVTRIVMEHGNVLQMHGFYADTVKKTAAFDIIIDYGYEDRDELYAHITQDIREAYPDWTFRITMDIDVL